MRLTSIGDVIFALPALEVLRAWYPFARISWVVEDRAAAILEGNPLLDELIILPRKQWRAMRAAPYGTSTMLRAMREFGRRLRARRFDVAIDLQGNIKSGLVTWSTRAPLRLGLGRSECREPNWLFTNRRVALRDPAIHRIERDLTVLTLLGIPYEFRWPEICYRDEDRRRVDDFFAENGLESADRPVCVLHPGTSAWGRHKRWPAEHYARLADGLARERGAHVVLSWGPGERELCDEIKTLATDAAPIHAPDLVNMREVGYLMRRADLVVGSDTGPTHLAAVQQTDTVILFGPYDPRLYYPYRHPERAHFAGLPCSPCRYRACPSRLCMLHIAPEDVLQTCLAAVDGRPLAPRNIMPNKTVRV